MKLYYSVLLFLFCLPETLYSATIEEETFNRQWADGNLQSQITQEVWTRQGQDINLNGRVTTEASARTNGDKALRTDLTAEEDQRQTSDQELQQSVDNLSQRISNINTHTHKKVTTSATIRLRLLDTKRLTFSCYDAYNLDEQTQVLGAEVTLKLGSSYEERKIKDLERQLQNVMTYITILTREDAR
jgi:hypothetical protein